MPRSARAVGKKAFMAVALVIMPIRQKAVSQTCLFRTTILMASAIVALGSSAAPAPASCFGSLAKTSHRIRAARLMPAANTKALLTDEKRLVVPMATAIASVAEA